MEWWIRKRKEKKKKKRTEPWIWQGRRPGGNAGSSISRQISTGRGRKLETVLSA
jgi:hypothetical protein